MNQEALDAISGRVNKMAAAVSAAAYMDLAAEVADDAVVLLAEVERLRGVETRMRSLAYQADRYGLILDDGDALRDLLDGAP